MQRENKISHDPYHTKLDYPEIQGKPYQKALVVVFDPEKIKRSLFLAKVAGGKGGKVPSRYFNAYK